MSTPQFNSSRILGVFGALFSLIACGAGPVTESEANGELAARELAPVSNAPLVDWETYRASAREVSGQGLLVERDLLFPNEETLYAYWQSQYAAADQEALTVHTVTQGNVVLDDIWPLSTRMHIKYCVSAGFTSAQLTQLLPALDRASNAWSRIAAVKFERLTVSPCDRNTPQTLFNIEPTTYSAAQYPSIPRASRALWLDADGMDDVFNSTLMGRDLQGVLTHEFGHILGFKHEHIWLGSSCVANSDELTTNARQLTTYDVDSVMHYPVCRPSKDGGFHMTRLDETGAVSIYGLEPTLNGITTSLIDI